MKKTIMALLCACMFLLPGFTSNDPDLNKAAEVAEAYMYAISKGDIETMLKLSSKEHRDAFIEGKTAEEPFFKIVMIMLQAVEYKLVSMEKYDAENAEATLSIRLPDFDAIMDDASNKIYAEYGQDITDAEMFAHILPMLPDMLKDPKYAAREEDETDLDLIKENGQWKVDESFN